MAEPSAPAVRLMAPGDVQACIYIRKAGLEGLARNEGREPNPWIPGGVSHLEHLLRTDPEGSWVATINGLVVGFAQGFVRGDIWFLAQLFVQPDVHARGVGQELLRRAIAYGREKGARVLSVVSSTSPVAQSLYMREGMFAIGIGYAMTGPVDALRALPEPDATRKRIVDCGAWLDKMAELDRAVFGAERREDHAYHLSPARAIGEAASFGLSRDGALAGYGYVDDTGWIAPLAAWEPEDQLPLLRMAGDWLAEREVGDGRMWVLSANQTIMSALLAGGWKLGSWTFFLANERFGRFDRYHPANGLLL